MMEPPRLSFMVACPRDHAFATWTQGIGSWWPADHLVSGEPRARVIIEPRVGGRIYERAPDGREFDWGRLTEWEPPARLSYLWHLGTVAAQGTDVQITFTALDAWSTQVDIEHGGWDRLGPAGPDWRQANQHGWDGLLGALHRCLRGLGPAPGSPLPSDAAWAGVAGGREALHFGGQGLEVKGLLQP